MVENAEFVQRMIYIVCAIAVAGLSKGRSNFYILRLKSVDSTICSGVFSGRKFSPCGAQNAIKTRTR
jgi:hypothetical protein